MSDNNTGRKELWVINIVDLYNWTNRRTGEQTHGALCNWILLHVAERKKKIWQEPFSHFQP